MTFVGLAFLRPCLKRLIGVRENPTDIYLGAMLCMGIGLILLGAAVTRPLAYFLI